MNYGIDRIKMIPVDRVYLDLENPRHEPMETQDEVIDFLLKDEQVLQLAADIAKHALNPLDLFAVVENEGGGKNETYTVAEGNRRLCAIMLLNDPDLAPAKKRKDFERLSNSADYIPSEITAIVFDNTDDGKLWIERLHGGQQGGIGRKNWNAEQKNRYTGSSKNAVAQALLDVAEEQDLITAEDRKRKLTTVQRYMNNSHVREAMGIDISNPDGISRTRSVKDFKHLLQRFIIDLLDGEVNSRKNKDDITAYARELGAMEGLSHKRMSPVLIQDDTKKAGKKKTVKRRKPLKQPRVSYNEDIDEAIRGIPSYKLESLYTSLITLKYTDHAPLLAIGLWAFIETLTSLCGRKDSVDIIGFLSKQKLSSLGVTGQSDSKAIRGALNRIVEHGNTTKHHKISASFSGEQMSNDVETITQIIIALAEEARAKIK